MKGFGCRKAVLGLHAGRTIDDFRRKGDNLVVFEETIELIEQAQSTIPQRFHPAFESRYVTDYLFLGLRT